MKTRHIFEGLAAYGLANGDFPRNSTGEVSLDAIVCELAPGPNCIPDEWLKRSNAQYFVNPRLTVNDVKNQNPNFIALACKPRLKHRDNVLIVCYADTHCMAYRVEPEEYNKWLALFRDKDAEIHSPKHYWSPVDD